ncbi:MAG: DUF1223 domain-containing protein, partial [Bacteroidota bacterium]
KKNDPGVIALSYHVDYWNYIGWSDPYSKAEYTQRQRAYNIAFKSRSNYTPQLVVNGSEHFVGSHAGKLNTALQKYGRVPTGNAITISELSPKAKTISFSYEVKGDRTGKEIRAILVLDQRETQVSRGENRNRTLRNSNIVVAEKLIEPMGPLGKASLDIPKIVKKGEKIKLVLLIQDEDLEITGATQAQL